MQHTLNARSLTQLPLSQFVTAAVYSAVLLPVAKSWATEDIWFNSRQEL